jgi:hypothetical protein
MPAEKGHMRWPPRKQERQNAKGKKHLPYSKHLTFSANHLMDMSNQNCDGPHTLIWSICTLVVSTVTNGLPNGDKRVARVTLRCFKKKAREMSDGNVRKHSRRRKGLCPYSW